MLFGTPTLQECKEAAVLHKTTGDEKLFLRFLVRFELYGYYTMHRVLRGCPSMRKASLEDIKQTVIVGILRAFKTVRLDERPEYLPLRVSSYVRKEMNSVFRHLKVEYGKIDEEMDVATLDTMSYTAVNPAIDAFLFASSDIFTVGEKELLYRRYALGETHEEISKALRNTSRNQVCRKLQRLRDLVAQYLMRDGIKIVKKKYKSRKQKNAVLGLESTSTPSVGESVQEELDKEGGKG